MFRILLRTKCYNSYMKYCFWLQNVMLEELNVTIVINETSKAIVESVMSTTMINDGPLVDSDAVSPVTLSMEWSRVARLLIMLGLSVIGSIGNVYMISSVMIEDHLNKRGEYIIISELGEMVKKKINFIVWYSSLESIRLVER